DAVATNSTVEVPIGEALAALPGSPLESLFVQNAKSSPAALSLVEADQAAAQAETFIRDEAGRVMAEAVNQDQWQAEQQQVHDDVSNQVKALGRWSDKASDAYAQLHAAFFSTLAARLGTTPKALYDRYALTVRNAEEAPPPLAAVAQGMKAGNSGEENRDWLAQAQRQLPGRSSNLGPTESSLQEQAGPSPSPTEAGIVDPSIRSDNASVEQAADAINNPSGYDQAFRPRSAILYTRKLDALKAEKLGRGEPLEMGPTPQALQLGGLPNLPLHYKQGEARKTLLEKHAGLIDEETLRRLPDVLADPILVIRQGNGRYGVLIKDGRNQDVLVVLQPGAIADNHRVNLV
ncbi:MAG: hypothetical protein DI607_14930, partial [Sphingomonas hengshuiensis]